MAPRVTHPRTTDRNSPGTSLDAHAVAEHGCTTCGQPPGRRCTSATGKRLRSHAARWAAARPAWEYARTQPDDLPLKGGAWVARGSVLVWTVETH